MYDFVIDIAANKHTTTTSLIKEEGIQVTKLGQESGPRFTMKEIQLFLSNYLP